MLSWLPARQELSPQGVTELKFGDGKVGQRVRAGDALSKPRVSQQNQQVLHLGLSSL